VSSKKIGLLLGPALFLITLFCFNPKGLNNEAIAVLACTLWIATWWILEVIPIAITALLPIILFPLMDVLSLSETTVSFGHRYVFLYIGGFILAIAMERWSLHRRIALNVIFIIGTNIKKIILGFMIATAFLSMWVSNTATSVMMLPIAMAIINQLTDNPDTVKNENSVFGKALMLSVAYSASIGGMATLIGTPVNLIMVGIVQELYGIEITFSQWFMIALPISIILLLLCWKYLTELAFSFDQNSFPGGRAKIKEQLVALKEISYEEKAVLFVFILTAFAWISRSFFLNKFIPNLDDPIIGVFTVFALFIIPAGKGKNRPLIIWKEAVNLPWDVLLLFGGGLALAEGFKTSGLAVWIGNQLALLEGFHLIVLLFILIAAVNFLTEITSNLATVAMLLPILGPLALAVDVHPFILMVGATVAASCAFMLPVATPPNAVVFGSGFLKISDMLKAGIWMNILSILLLTIIIYFVLPYLWTFEPNEFPVTLRKE
jgi:sodium-dependent dicarboxylate transporter 2/3/5